MTLPRLASQQHGVSFSHRLKEVRANGIVPVRLRPAAIAETAIGIFLGAARRLDHAVERNELGNNKFSHGCSSLECPIWLRLFLMG